MLLAKDLFGDWVITKAWGSIGKAQGRVVHLPFDSYVEAKKAIAAITTLRERRGYHVRGEIKNTTIKDG